MTDYTLAIIAMTGILLSFALAALLYRSSEKCKEYKRIADGFPSIVCKLNNRIDRLVKANNDDEEYYLSIIQRLTANDPEVNELLTKYNEQTKVIEAAEEERDAIEKKYRNITGQRIV